MRCSFWLGSCALMCFASRSWAETIDFDTQVMPILTKAGCNAGACHGAADGRGGLRLSLYGSNPLRDYWSLVAEHEGRRVNLRRPDASLLLRKPTGELDHGGGTPLDADGVAAEILTEWIAQGALRVESRSLQAVRVEPERQVAEIGVSLPIRVVARFADGEQDVTPWSVFRPDDPLAVQVNDGAVATVTRPGRHVVVVRYLDRVLPIELVVPYGSAAVDLSAEPRRNLIDDEVLSLLEQLRLRPAAAADDEAFLRRVTIDLTGRLPDPGRVAAFLQDSSPGRRAAYIDELLASEPFVEYWTYRVGMWLRMAPPGRGGGGDLTSVRVYRDWLAAQLRGEVNFANIAQALLTALGDSRELGPPNFYRTVNGPREQAEFVSELLMGVRLRCANCHDHPLDHWTQDDYHGLAAVFAKVEQREVVQLVAFGDVTHPRTGEPAVARIPGRDLQGSEADSRVELANWLVDPTNPYFARATVNRLWQAMFGQGLVEPVDDMRVTNVPTHPQLLDRLAEDFVNHQFDLRHTLRLIANSSTYARSSASDPSEPDDGRERYLPRMRVRPLLAEVHADSICDVTGVWDVYEAHPVGTRAIALLDPTLPSVTLDVLGRCSRVDSCDDASASRGNELTKMLHLFNGPTLNDKIREPNGRLARQLSVATDAQIVEDFYRRALGRGPTSAEWSFWNAACAEASDPASRVAVLEDFVWSLLTCREFVTNH